MLKNMLPFLFCLVSSTAFGVTDLNCLPSTSISPGQTGYGVLIDYQYRALRAVDRTTAVIYKPAVSDLLAGSNDSFQIATMLYRIPVNEIRTRRTVSYTSSDGTFRLHQVRRISQNHIIVQIGVDLPHFKLNGEFTCVERSRIWP